MSARLIARVGSARVYDCAYQARGSAGDSADNGSYVAAAYAVETPDGACRFYSCRDDAMAAAASAEYEVQS